MDNISIQIKRLTTIASVAVAITAIGSAVIFILNNIKPKIKIEAVDYRNGIATVLVNSKEKILYANSTLNCGNGWGLRFGTFQTDKNIPTINRIELVKNNIVYETLNVR